MTYTFQIIDSNGDTTFSTHDLLTALDACHAHGALLDTKLRVAHGTQYVVFAKDGYTGNIQPATKFQFDAHTRMDGLILPAMIALSTYRGAIQFRFHTWRDAHTQEVSMLTVDAPFINVHHALRFWNTGIALFDTLYVSAAGRTASYRNNELMYGYSTTILRGYDGVAIATYASAIVLSLFT